MISIPSAPYFINALTFWSAPAAFLFLHFFTSSVVNSLCDPAEPLSSLADPNPNPNPSPVSVERQRRARWQGKKRRKQGPLPRVDKKKGPRCAKSLGISSPAIKCIRMAYSTHLYVYTTRKTYRALITSSLSPKRVIRSIDVRGRVYVGRTPNNVGRTPEADSLYLPPGGDISWGVVSMGG